MDCSLIPAAVKVTSQRRPKTLHDGYIIHNAPIFLSSCPPSSQSFQWSSLRRGLDTAISSVELSLSLLSSLCCLRLYRRMMKCVTAVGQTNVWLVCILILLFLLQENEHDYPFTHTYCMRSELHLDFDSSPVTSNHRDFWVFLIFFYHLLLSLKNMCTHLCWVKFMIEYIASFF